MVLRAENSCMVLTLQAPFTYEALPPEKINFVPLKQKKSFNAKELMQVLMPTLFLSSVVLAGVHSVWLSCLTCWRITARCSSK